jgi:hypothetical protein
LKGIERRNSTLASRRQRAMAIDYSIDSGTGVITMTLTGDVTVVDFLDYFEASRMNPKYSADFHRLVIIRDVRTFPRSTEIRDIASRLRTRTVTPSVHIGIVADTLLGRGLMAMLMGNAGLAERYRVFDDTTSALAWLVTQGRALATSV